MDITRKKWYNRGSFVFIIYQFLVGKDEAMAKNFSDLKKIKTIREFNKLCAEIAREYAETDIFQAETYFTEEYGITPSCYRKMKEYAVTHYLVSDWIVGKMEEKAKANQTRSCSYSRGKSSSTYYSKLLQERRKYCVGLMRDFATSILTVHDFVEIHGIFDARLFASIIKEALTTKDAFQYDEIKQIQIRMMQECTSMMDMKWMCEFFLEIWKTRSL